MTKKIDLSNTFWILIFFLPVIDTLNGFINGGGNDSGLSLGIFYRVFIVLMCLILLIKNGISKKTALFYFFFVSYCLISVMISGKMVGSYILILCRLLLPMLIITVVESCSGNDSFKIGTIDKLFSSWEFIFPLTILIPYILGIGLQTYGDGAAGYKGFYYAQNDIGYVLNFLYLFAMYKLWKKMSLKNVLAIFLLLVTNLVLGLKSNYMIIIAITFIYIFNFKDLKKRLSSKLITIFLLLLGLLIVFTQYNTEIQSIISRWVYFYNQKTGLSFWTSSRIDRVPLVFKWLENQWGFLGILIGTGLTYMEHSVIVGTNFIEMDFFDVFFQLGVIGLIFVYGFYFHKFKTFHAHGVYKWGFLLSIICSTLAGHVLESALSGMFFAMVCSGIVLNAAYEEKNIKIQKM